MDAGALPAVLAAGQHRRIHRCAVLRPSIVRLRPNRGHADLRAPGDSGRDLGGGRIPRCIHRTGPAPSRAGQRRDARCHHVRAAAPSTQAAHPTVRCGADPRWIRAGCCAYPHIGAFPTASCGDARIRCAGDRCLAGHVHARRFPRCAGGVVRASAPRAARFAGHLRLGGGAGVAGRCGESRGEGRLSRSGLAGVRSGSIMGAGSVPRALSARCADGPGLSGGDVRDRHLVGECRTPARTGRYHGEITPGSELVRDGPHLPHLRHRRELVLHGARGWLDRSSGIGSALGVRQGGHPRHDPRRGGRDQSPSRSRTRSPRLVAAPDR